MNKFLFLFTIGPVQSFIAEARRTQDLYGGSRLLSDLISFAIDELSDSVDVIFPNKSIDSKPNRLIAIIKTDNPVSFGKIFEGRVKGKFKDLAKEIFPKKISRIKTLEKFNQQIGDFLEIYWVMLPYKNNYSEIYKEIEKTLGAIKNVRVFGQLAETGKKCSLCGKRNVLFYRLTDKEEGEGGLKQRKDGLLSKLYIKKDEVVILDDNKLNKGEGLCAICFVKRFYKAEADKPFSSTAEIASIDWVEKIKRKEEIKLKLEEYKKLFVNFDAQLFYRENLREDYLKRYGYFNCEENLEKAKIMLDRFYDPGDEKEKIGEPLKHYVFFRLDMDDMGKLLCGKGMTNGRSLKGFQKELSRKLGTFSEKLKGYINDNRGKTVYAGGDDFLAFVNLSYLFDVIEEAKNLKKELGEEGLTYSISIIISHYKSPLHKVIEYSKNLLNEVKTYFKDKNGIGIIVLNHSTLAAKCFCKYEDFLTLSELKKSGFANRLHFKLSIEFSFLRDFYSFEKYLRNKDMVKNEIKRLLKRENSRSEDEKLYEKFCTKIYSFLGKQIVEKSPNVYELDFDNFLGYLKTLEQLRKVTK